MTIANSAAVALAASLLLAGAASAQGGMSATRQACQADMQKLCNGVQPGGGRVMQCFKQHKDELSAPCKAAIAERMSQKRAGKGGEGASSAAPSN